MKYIDKYLPIDPEIKDKIVDAIVMHKLGKVHFFDNENGIGLAEGEFREISNDVRGSFLIVGKTHVRLDKIITYAGIPGPAYDAYDRYANVCLTCEDLGQFGS